ncbi:FAD-dependent oxidoreductase [Paenibacillus oryzisoli]|uniref:FAD-dependent oxidoreductase n=1 Tax=Paenibacillus oryzisoli TaxID=1850517 RepID=UPI003D29C20E
MSAIMEVITADVLIAGGGTSGCNAALAAARDGARTVLLEMDDGVGGVAVRANVCVYHFGSRGGIQNEVDRRVMSRQKLFGGREELSHPEAKRSVYSELLRDGGVHVLLGHLIYDVLVEEGAVVGVLAAGLDGLKEIRAKVTVDCTAEGDVSAMAGAFYSVGRTFDRVSHSYSLCPRIMLFNPKSGKLRIHLKNFDAGWVHSPSVEDVSRAYREGRRHILNLLERKEADIHMVSLAPKLGIREGRHIVGDYVLTINDFLHDRRFEDVISRAYSYYDTHARDLGNESDFAQIWLVILDRMEKDGYWCDIPYRSLLPRGIDGLLVASRAFSVDRDVSMAVRMQRDIQKIGEAAGVAAAMAVRLATVPRLLSVAALQSRLTELGILKSQDLSRTDTDTTNLQFHSGELSQRPLSPEYVRNLLPQEAACLAELLVMYLGTEEQAAAVWWLQLLDDYAAKALLKIIDRQLASEAPSPACRTAALALALIGRPEAEPVLLRMFRSRINGRTAHASYPEWIAALASLRLMRSGAVTALEIADALIESNYDTGINSILLQYLATVCDKTDPQEREKLADSLLQWAARPETGANYMPDKAEVQLSVRWNMHIRIGMVLTRLGMKQGRELCESWLKDERLPVRWAAEAALRQIEDHSGEPAKCAEGGDAL